MKRIILLLALAAVVVSCQNKDLGDLGISDKNKADVRVRINWTDGTVAPVEDGMRINIFSLDDNPSYGMDDVEYTGSVVKLAYGTSHRTFAYTYRGNNIYFRNQLDIDLIEAYCSPMVRTTYSRAFPEEQTVGEPQGNFYVGENQRYTVEKSESEQYIDVTPENVLYTYTFEVCNVLGAEFIYETRGAISGMSSSYFMSTRTLSTYPSTVLFNATVNAAENKIEGSFRTFGRLNTNNKFTIEILYPSNTDGIVQAYWDVTDQIVGDNNFHIVIEDSGIEIPDEGGAGASGWQVDLNDWEDVTVPLT